MAYIRDEYSLNKQYTDDITYSEIRTRIKTEETKKLKDTLLIVEQFSNLLRFYLENENEILDSETVVIYLTEFKEYNNKIKSYTQAQLELSETLNKFHKVSVSLLLKNNLVFEKYIKELIDDKEILRIL